MKKGKKQKTPKRIINYGAETGDRVIQTPSPKMTRGTSTFDGEKCEAVFNVSNWP